MRWLLVFLAAFGVPSSEALACTKEIGTQFPEVGTYVTATSSSNFHIESDDCLVSPNRRFIAIMQTDGNFVVYASDHIDPEYSLWDSQTAGNHGASVLVQQDGHFVVYSKYGVSGPSSAPVGDPKESKFQSNIALPVGDYFLSMQNDGNLVLYAGENPGKAVRYLWASREHQSEHDRDYCVSLMQNSATNVFEKTVREKSLAEVDERARRIMDAYNSSTIPSRVAMYYNITSGKC